MDFSAVLAHSNAATVPHPRTFLRSPLRLPALPSSLHTNSRLLPPTLALAASANHRGWALNVVRAGMGVGSSGEDARAEKEMERPALVKVLVGAGVGVLVLGLAVGLFAARYRSVAAVDGGVVKVGRMVVGRSGDLIRGAWPKVLRGLTVFKEEGFVLVALLGISAFFSMSETAITTLWPWKVRELAEKEPENGVFRILRSDVNRFLTTILIGTTVASIGATAIFTDSATALFGEVGVTAATGVMTVAVLLLTEITPKSIGIHNATEVARIVVRPIAWLSVVLYPLGRVAAFLSMGIQKMLGLRARSEPYVTEDELKLMLRGAELSGAIEEEEQDMIENVLEIKDTFVREVMTPLVDVIAIDASARLVDFQKLWVIHPYSRLSL